MSTPAPRRLDVDHLRREMARIKATYPLINEEGNEDLLSNTMEGEVFLHEYLDDIVVKVQEAQVLADKLIMKIKQRHERYKQIVAAGRELMLLLLLESGLKQAKLPHATLSIVPGRPKVIVDEARLPAQYWKEERSPKLRELLVLLKEGAIIEGAVLSNPAETLRIG